MLHIHAIRHLRNVVNGDLQPYRKHGRRAKVILALAVLFVLAGCASPAVESRATSVEAGTPTQSVHSTATKATAPSTQTPNPPATNTTIPLPNWLSTPQPPIGTFYGGGEQWLLLLEQVEIHQVLGLMDDSMLAIGSLALDTAENRTDAWIARFTRDGALMWSKVLQGTQVLSAYENETGNLMLISKDTVFRLSPDGGLWDTQTYAREISGVAGSTGDPLWVQRGTRGGAMIFSETGLMTWIQPDGQVTEQFMLQMDPSSIGDISWVMHNAMLTASEMVGMVRVERHGLQSLSWMTTLDPGIDTLVEIRPILLRSTDEGGALLAAYVETVEEVDTSSIWLVKLHPSGEAQWQRTLHIEAIDHIFAQQLSEGGWVIGMAAESTDAVFASDFTLMRLSPDGDLVWEQNVGDEVHSPRLRSVAESPEGDLLLGFDLLNANTPLEGRLGMIARITGAGISPGCAWFQPSSGHRSTTPTYSSTLSTLGIIEVVPREIMPIQSGNIDVQSVFLRIQQVCVHPRLDPTPIPTPTPTLDLSSIVGKHVFQIFNKQGMLLGGVQHEGEWVNPQLAAARLLEGDIFYGYLNGRSRGPFLVAPDQQFTDCHGMPWYKFSPLVAADLIFNVPWDPIPRTAAPLAHDSPTYEAILRDVLRERGISDPVINITDLQKIDLDGDGFDEVLLEAKQINSRLGETYSVIILRMIIDGEAQTIVLMDTLSPQAPASEKDKFYELSGVYDLDGDGILEIAVNAERGVEGGSYSVIFDVQNGKVEHVLGETCP